MVKKVFINLFTVLQARYQFGRLYYVGKKIKLFIEVTACLFFRYLFRLLSIFFLAVEKVAFNFIFC